MSSAAYSFTLRRFSNKIHVRRVQRKRRKHRKSNDFRSHQTETTITSHHLFNSNLIQQKSTPQKRE